MKALLKKVGYAAALALGGVYVYLAMNGPHGIPALMEKRRDILAMQESNADLAREIQSRRERIKKLKESREEQELEIRRRLKLLRPGETYFILPETPKEQPAK